MNAEIVRKNKDGSMLVRIVPGDEDVRELLKESALKGNVHYHYLGAGSGDTGIELNLEFRKPKRTR
jgi:hypothetical protein